VSDLFASQKSFPASLAEKILGETGENEIVEALADGLVRRPEVVQVRVWLVREGDLCDGCAMRRACPDRTRCLHLVAARTEAAAEGAAAERSGGFARRFPIGPGVLGRTARDGAGEIVPDLRRDTTWRRASEWIRREGIRGLAVEPLISRGEVRGIVGVFARVEASAERFGWLRPTADLVAAALSPPGAAGTTEPGPACGVSEGGAPPTRRKRRPARARVVSGGRPIRTEAEMREEERSNLVRALDSTAWKIYGEDGAAALLGIAPTTLASRMRKMGISRPDRARSSRPGPAR
jgi:hypothetical protein